MGCVLQIHAVVVWERFEGSVVGEFVEGGVPDDAVYTAPGTSGEGDPDERMDAKTRA